MATTPSTDLSTVNKTSIKFASWLARAAHARGYRYTYKSKKTGQDVIAWKFECRFVGKAETDYLLAVLKGTEPEVNQASSRYTNGSVWELSNIKFEENTTPAFISTSLKFSRSPI